MQTTHTSGPYVRISNILVREVQMEDESEFRSMFRMNAENFQFLFGVGPSIAKQDTLMRESVSAVLHANGWKSPYATWQQVNLDIRGG